MTVTQWAKELSRHREEPVPERQQKKRGQGCQSLETGLVKGVKGSSG